MWACACAVVLLAQQRDAPLDGAVDDSPPGHPVEPKAAGGRGRIGREKAISNEDRFLVLLYSLVLGVVRSLRRGVVLARAVEGELVTRRIAQGRRQSRT